MRSAARAAFAAARDWITSGRLPASNISMQPRKSIASTSEAFATFKICSTLAAVAFASSEEVIMGPPAPAAPGGIVLPTMATRLHSTSQVEKTFLVMSALVGCRDTHGRILARKRRGTQSVWHCWPIGVSAKSRFRQYLSLNLRPLDCGCRTAPATTIWLGVEQGANSDVAHRADRPHPRHRFEPHADRRLLRSSRAHRRGARGVGGADESQSGLLARAARRSDSLGCRSHRHLVHRFPANPENCYHPRQFRVYSGNPD